MLYKIGIESGGLMEDPESRIENVQTIEADTLENAKLIYAEKNGHTKSEYWDAHNFSVWGWRILSVKTE